MKAVAYSHMSVALGKRRRGTLQRAPTPGDNAAGTWRLSLSSWRKTPYRNYQVKRGGSLDNYSWYRTENTL